MTFGNRETLILGFLVDVSDSRNNVKAWFTEKGERSNQK